MKRRSFLKRLAEAAAIVALAPQIAFRAPKPKFEPDGLQWRSNSTGIREILRQSEACFDPSVPLKMEDWLRQCYAIKESRGEQKEIELLVYDTPEGREMASKLGFRVLACLAILITFTPVTTRAQTLTHKPIEPWLMATWTQPHRLKKINIGERHWRFTIAGESEAVLSGGKLRRMVECVCDCGARRVVFYQSLRSGASKSCGCLRERMRSPVKEGDRYGKLVIIHEVEKTAYGKRKFLCRCDCGNELEYLLHTLDGNQPPTRDCGCVRRKGVPKELLNVPERQVWASMIYRCHDARAQAYRLYGARGITVCGEWRNSFMAFYNEMGPRPSDKHSIDRIDGNLGYSKCNCRWATWDVQGQNKRNIVSTPEIVREIRSSYANGETVAVLAKRLGMNRGTVSGIAHGEHWKNII